MTEDFRTILWRPESADEQDSMQQDALDHTDDSQKSGQKTTEKIILAIQNNPRITNRELAELLGLTEDGIFWNMKKLKTKGILRRVGPDKGGPWEIIPTDR